MNPSTTLERLVDWAMHLPIRLAYRIVWLTALTGHSNARAVYDAMWEANLNLPKLPEAKCPAI